jgi:hypothetical protein
MDLRKRIQNFSILGTRLKIIARKDEFQKVVESNSWFTGSELVRALDSWSALLVPENLISWTSRYHLADVTRIRNILVITAGNIPLAGFHDFLSVLISGNRFAGQLSSRDEILLTILAEELIGIEPSFSDQIAFSNLPASPDAVIATGSTNSARYFQRVYGSLPCIIRKNRSSAAILDGKEDQVDLENLANDILAYYGLGCRSVSHLFIPSGYSPVALAKVLHGYGGIDPCVHFTDNIRFQRARLSMLDIPFIDSGQVLLVESAHLHSPIGVVHYSFYSDRHSLYDYLETREDEIQCLAGHAFDQHGMVPFGKAQKPELWDYADGTDTLGFLSSLQ